MFKENDKMRKQFDYLEQANRVNDYKVRFCNCNGFCPTELIISYSTRLFAVGVKIGNHHRMTIVAMSETAGGGREFGMVCNLPCDGSDYDRPTEIKIRGFELAKELSEGVVKGIGNMLQSDQAMPFKSIEVLDKFFKFYHYVDNPELISILRTFAMYHWSSVALMSNTMAGTNLRFADKYPTCPILDWAYVPAIWHPLVADNFQKKLGTMADVWEMGYDGLEAWLRENFDHNSHDFENNVKKVLHDVNAWFNYHIGMHQVAINAEMNTPDIPRLSFCRWESRQIIRWNDYYVAIANAVAERLKVKDKLDDLAVAI